MQILTVLYALACIFGAAVVRGYSGFGFFACSPWSRSRCCCRRMRSVPSIFMMEVVASLHLLPGVWRDIHWRALLWLAVRQSRGHALWGLCARSCAGGPHDPGALGVRG